MTAGWMAVELALVEESWWQKIWSNRRAADERALAKQVQAFLEKQPLSELRGQPSDYRQECWRRVAAGPREAADLRHLSVYFRPGGIAGRLQEVCGPRSVAPRRP